LPCRLPIVTIVVKSLNMAESNGKGSHNETSSGIYMLLSLSKFVAFLFSGPVHCRHDFWNWRCPCL